MNITWEILVFFLTVTNGVAGYFLRRLISQVDKLSTCVTKQGERWIAHQEKHIEMREDQKASEKDIWEAIDRLRKR